MKRLDGNRLAASMGSARLTYPRHQRIIRAGTLAVLVVALLLMLAGLFLQPWLFVAGGGVLFVWVLLSKLFITVYGRRVDLSRSVPSWRRHAINAAIWIAFILVAISLWWERSP